MAETPSLRLVRNLPGSEHSPVMTMDLEILQVVCRKVDYYVTHHSLSRRSQPISHALGYSPYENGAGKLRLSACSQEALGMDHW
jgi:hypothetical protein